MAKKKVEVTLETIPQVQKTMWQKIKDWFYNSGTIMWNWMLGLAGSATAIVMGILSSVDWTTPMNILRSGAQFSKEQWMLIGLGTFAAGIIGYFTRTSGTKVVEGHLLPKAE